MSKRKWFFVSQCLVACALMIALLISVLGVPWVQAMSKRKWFFVSQCLVACALIIALLISVLGVPWVQAWSSDPTENTAVCTASNNQRYPAIVSDGSGGTIITWEDYRGGTHYDIRPLMTSTIQS